MLQPTYILFIFYFITIFYFFFFPILSFTRQLKKKKSTRGCRYERGKKNFSIRDVRIENGKENGMNVYF